MIGGLVDALLGYHMGITADNIADHYKISRQEQDEWALMSHQRACEAIKKGLFKDEIVPVEIKTKKGPVVFDTDEHPRADTNMEALGKLKPAFKKDGTVTAGNASGLNDAGSCMIMMAAEKAKENGYQTHRQSGCFRSRFGRASHHGHGRSTGGEKCLEIC